MQAESIPRHESFAVYSETKNNDKPMLLRHQSFTVIELAQRNEAYKFDSSKVANDSSENAEKSHDLEVKQVDNSPTVESDIKVDNTEGSGENGSTIQESSQCSTEDSNKTSNLGVGAEIASKKNLSDNLTSTGQNTRTFGSGYIPTTTKIFGSSISSTSQSQIKVSSQCKFDHSKNI
jgi:hypothetical protein